MKLMRFAAMLAVSAAGVLAVGQAFAGEMRIDEAKRFIAGKLYSFRCFDGTAGTGRIQHDGSVMGIVRFGGAGAMRYVNLPSGTLRVKGQNWCASLKGSSFEPCFDLVKIDEYSFRGSLTGLGFVSCSFTRRARSDFIRTSASARATSAATAEKKADASE